MAHKPWPKGADDGPKKPIYTCSGCGAQSTSPINHNHGRRSR